MGTIEVINIHSTIVPTDGVYIYIGRGKTSVLGNPFTHKRDGTLAQYYVPNREMAISGYETYLEESYRNNEEFKKRIDEIYDFYSHGSKIYLGCFCAPKSCHGDIIKKYIEKRYIKEHLKIN